MRGQRVLRRASLSLTGKGSIAGNVLLWPKELEVDLRLGDAPVEQTMKQADHERLRPAKVIFGVPTRQHFFQERDIDESHAVTAFLVQVPRQGSIVTEMSLDVGMLRSNVSHLIGQCMTAAIARRMDEVDWNRYLAVRERFEHRHHWRDANST